MKGLLGVAKENLHSEVMRSNSFSKVEAPSFLKPTLEENSPEFSVAIGLALRQLS